MHNLANKQNERMEKCIQMYGVISKSVNFNLLKRIKQYLCLFLYYAVQWYLENMSIWKYHELKKKSWKSKGSRIRIKRK